MKLTQTEATKTIRDFIAYCQYQNRSNNTIISYLTDLIQFELYIGKDILDAKYEDIISWLGTIENPATSNRKLMTLKSFYSWTTDNARLTNINIAKNISSVKYRQEERDYVERNEYTEIRKSLMNRNYKYANRDILIIDLLFNCGLRVAELVSLNVSDFNMEDKSFYVIGKGNKKRIAFMNDNVFNSLNKWLEDRAGLVSNNTDALLPTKTSDRMSVRAVQKFVNKYADTHPHAFRHGLASLMINERNVSLPIVAKTLGHSSTKVTERYVHVNNDAMRNAANMI